MSATNSELKKQHEKCARILTLAISAKAIANQKLTAINKLVAQGRSQDVSGISVFEYRSQHRWWQLVYERLMRFYRKQVSSILGDDYVHVNSIGTL